MPEREKVFNAYECVRTRGKSVCECGKCDYHVKDSAVFFCDNQRVLTDILSLLKEQENSIPISWFEQYTRLKCSESWHNMALAIIETWKTVNNIPTQTNTQKNALDVR